MTGVGEETLVIPDLAEPVEGWRCWKVNDPSLSPLVLLSPHQSTVWPPVNRPENYVFRGEPRSYITAKCSGTFGSAQIGPHPCPSPMRVGHNGMGCGIYAYKTIEDLAWDYPFTGLRHRKHLHHEMSNLLFGRTVWGKVLLWGDVYEHQYGYRAQYAQVKELVWIDAFTPSDVAARCADFYGVEAVRLPSSTVEQINSIHAERVERENLPDISTLSMVTNMALALGQEAFAKFIEALKTTITAIEEMGKDG